MSVNNRLSQNDLPLWMQQAQRGVDWGMLITIGFCLIAAWSFVTQSHLTSTNDIESYAFRSADYATLFAQGQFYTRWSPQAIDGLGAPVYHYYPPLSAYLGGLISYFFTNDALIAIRILIVLAIVMAGSMVYVFVMQRSHALAGIVSAVLYVFNPLVMRTIPHTIGDIPLLLGLALLPTTLWAVQRLQQRNQAIDIILVAASIAATILTSTPIFWQTLLMIIFFAIAMRYIDPPPHRSVSMISAIVLGICIASFYWLPALIEADAVHFYASSVARRPAILNLTTLFTSAPLLDGGLLLHYPDYSFGMGMAVALILTAIAALYRRQQLLWLSGMLILGAVLLVIILSQPQSASWLVLVLFCLAVVGSYFAQVFDQDNKLVFVIACAVILFCMNDTRTMWQLPKPLMPIINVDTDGQHQYEMNNYGTVGIPYGLVIPSRIAPSRSQDLTANRSSFSLNRLYANDVQLIATEELFAYSRYQIMSRRPNIATYYRAYFPGWSIESTHSGYTLSENSETHLMDVTIPSNSQAMVEIQLQATAIRTFAWFVSSVTLIILIIYTQYRRRMLSLNIDSGVLLPTYATVILGVLFVATAAIRLFPPDDLHELMTLRPRSSMTSALFVRRNFDSHLQLLAYDLPQVTYTANSRVQLQVYWQLTAPTTESYLVRLRLTNLKDGEILYVSPYHHPGYFPTHRWGTSQPVPETYEFLISEEHIATSYAIFLDVYVCPTLCAADTVDSQAPPESIRILRSLVIE